MAQLKLAIIGQSNFAAEVYKLLKLNGHQITGVFTIPDKGNREDPLGYYTKIIKIPRKIYIYQQILTFRHFVFYSHNSKNR